MNTDSTNVTEFHRKSRVKKTQQHTVAARPLLQVRKKLLFAKKTEQHKILYVHRTYTIQKCYGNKQKETSNKKNK